MAPDPPGPLCTRSSLATNLRSLGLQPGETILLHSSLKSLGFVVGGPQAVIEAFLDVLGPEGTLVVPTHTSDNSDPAQWVNPPVPETWWQVIRDSAPAFDPLLTPSRRMGVIPELLRTWPGATRSNNPQGSFAAVGRLAERITSGHAIDSRLGENSPLARLEEVDARVVLLGVGWKKCTVFHLAECRFGGSPIVKDGCAALINGKREWVTFEDTSVNGDDFDALGEAFEAAQRVEQGRVGGAMARVFSVRPAVAYALSWMQANRPDA